CRSRLVCCCFRRLFRRWPIYGDSSHKRGHRADWRAKASCRRHGSSGSTGRQLSAALGCRDLLQRNTLTMVRVRAAVPVDIPYLVEIAAHSVTAAQWNQGEYLQLFAQQSQQARLALVVEEGSEVVGFIVGRLIDQECEIENVAVRGAARRRGLGTRLLGEFLE